MQNVVQKKKRVRRDQEKSKSVRCALEEHEHAQIVDKLVSLGYKDGENVARRTLVLRFQLEILLKSDDAFRNTVMAKVSTTPGFVEHMEEYEKGLIFILKSREFIYMVDVFNSRENVILENFGDETAFNFFLLKANRKRTRGQNSKFLRDKKLCLIARKALLRDLLISTAVLASKTSLSRRKNYRK